MEIPRRNVEFGFAGVPRDWCQDDAYQTTFLNALSLLFPEGEQFFVRSVKKFQDQITDPELKREVIGFIGQEAMHGREHRAFNEMMVAHGYREAPHVELWLKGFLKTVCKVIGPKSQLAATCALEHFTAMLAEQLLTDARMRDAMDPSVRALWLWHALEESEHKAVAFDVYRAAGGGYARRAWIMFLATIVFFLVSFGVQMRLMATRGILLKPWRWVRGIGRLYVYPGFFTRLVPAYLSYFRPGFTPTIATPERCSRAGATSCSARAASSEAASWPEHRETAADSFLVIQLLYVSRATRPFDDAQLRALLDLARRRNALASITGGLLHQEGSFLQILEGPTKPVEALFAKLGRDPRHQRVTLLARNEIQEANFPDWSMGFVDVKGSAALLPGFRRIGDLSGLAGDTHAVEGVIQAFRGGRWRLAA